MLRLVAPLLALALVADIAPGIPPLPVPSAAAQTAYGIPNQGVLQYSTASVSCSNSTSACSLWSSTIPGAYMATAPSINSAYSPSFVTTPAPLHLQLHGQMTTNLGLAQVSPLNIGVNFGGGSTGVASLALANAYQPDNNQKSVPIFIDVWMSPVATATGTALPGAGACYFYMNASMRIATAASTGVLAGYPVTLDSHVCGTTGGAFLASAQQLNVIAQWASASLTNSLNIYRGVLLIGN